ncbi:MAG: HEPN domain-containing protein [Thermodesulfobacteriota bacterium]
MSERSRDWMNQAKKDLENAVWEVKGGYYEWACFISQQAAEKGIKAVYNRLGGEAWGHSIVNLLEGLKEKIVIDEDVIHAGRLLDRFYIPARYPNGWDAGIPHDYYTKEDAESAIGSAEKVLRLCEGLLAE